jgi:hypothetical protein
MMPTTPSGWAMMLARPGRNQIDGDFFCGFIHAPKCERVWRTASRLGNSSSRRVSCAERWPKSAEIAVTKRSALSCTSAHQRVQPRLAAIAISTTGLRRVAACMASKTLLKASGAGFLLSQ